MGDLSIQQLLKLELGDELKHILDYWMLNTVDEVNGGFFGKIDNENHVEIEAPKGSVLNARILWSFSAAYNQFKNEAYLPVAQRAYNYILAHFIDSEYGGVYWSVTFDGKPLDTKKQVYAIAFTIYGLSEYYLTGGDEKAKQQAIELYKLLVIKAYDSEQTGYYEAFTQNWQPMDDLRLSSKDANEKKTMNTHLHILEAYGNLYKIWPDEGLKEQIITLLGNFTGQIIDSKTNRLNLFFDEDWNVKPNVISYGHDIEASWLLLEAAEIIEDGKLVAKLKEVSVNMAAQAMEGLDADGALFYEFEPEHNHLINEKHWWVQAEAIVGFYNAWQISGKEEFLQAAVNAWNFIKNNILNEPYGEWYWGINGDGSLVKGEDKVGIWKCPYHNSRACMEILKRIN
jgi:mannobiose 2-epimerase